MKSLNELIDVKHLNRVIRDYRRLINNALELFSDEVTNRVLIPHKHKALKLNQYLEFALNHNVLINELNVEVFKSLGDVNPLISELYSDGNLKSRVSCEAVVYFNDLYTDLNKLLMSKIKPDNFSKLNEAYDLIVDNESIHVFYDKAFNDDSLYHKYRNIYFKLMGELAVSNPQLYKLYMNSNEIINTYNNANASNFDDYLEDASDFRNSIIKYFNGASDDLLCIYHKFFEAYKTSFDYYKTFYECLNDSISNDLRRRLKSLPINDRDYYLYT